MKTSFVLQVLIWGTALLLSGATAMAQPTQSCCEDAYDNFKTFGKSIAPSKFSCVTNEEKKAAQDTSAQIRRAKCLLMLAYDALEKKRFDKSLGHLGVLSGVLRPDNPEHSQYWANICNLKAYIYDQMAYQSLAEEYYRRAISLYEKDSLPMEALANESTLVKLLAEQGRFGEAIELGQNLSQIMENLPESERLGELKGAIANNLALAYTTQGVSYRGDMRMSDMKQAGAKGLDIFRNNLQVAYQNETDNVGLALVNLISTAYLLGSQDTLNHYLKVYFEGFGRKNPRHPYTALMLSIRAMTEASEGDFDAAFRDAIAPFRVFNLKVGEDSLATEEIQLPATNLSVLCPLVLTILQNKGNVLLRHYQKFGQIEYLEKALMAFAQAEKILEILQNELFDDSVLISTRLRFQTIYPNAARVAALIYRDLPPGEVDKRDLYWRKAFNYAEQAQGFALRQSVRANMETECPDASDQAPNCRERVLRDALFQLKRQGKEGEVMQKLEEYRQFIDSLKRSSNPAERQYYLQRFKYELTSPETVQQQLLPDAQTVFIEYVWSAPKPFALWITKQAKGLVLLNIDTTSSDDFWAKVSRFQSDWLREENRLDPKLGYALYEVLVKNVLDDIPATYRKEINHLVITQDNLLRTIPFDALPMSEKLDKNGLPFFAVNNYTVGYQHSATLWALQNDQSQKRLERNLVIGDFINVSAQTGCANPGDILVKLGNFSEQKLPKLKKQQVEVFPKARVENFLNTASRFDLLHFCMHGCLENNPENSYLSFFGDSDGDLSISRLYTMRINARLAVFASCETARQKGEHEGGLKGEGVIGLHRAINFAGCSNTIATLNKVKDESSARLLESFYENLLTKGMPADLALTQAKRAYLQNPSTFKHPLYWANFICTGPPAKFK